MAGLPGRRAMVSVGPPLISSPWGSSPGLATPIRLYALDEVRVPEMSLGIVGL
jgi:hypothetical protein